MFDPLVIASGLFVGFVVGLTGMGGGALMTPILVLLFHIQPLAAVSSDIVAAMVMKPIGGAVHWRRGTVRRDLVTWLMSGRSLRRSWASSSCAAWTPGSRCRRTSRSRSGSRCWSW